MRKIIFLSALLFNFAGTFACSCFGPDTFCGTLDPQPPEFPEPEWWIPDLVILGVKVGQEAHGMDVEVVHVIAGQATVGEIRRVWGDCGLLCRVYPDAWATGDTVVWAFQFTDLAGNALCGSSLEQEGDLMISVCGTYYLSYDQGMVSGPIAEGVEQLPYADFVQYIEACGSTGLNETATDGEFQVQVREGLLNVTVPGSGPIHYSLLDARGRLLSEGRDTGTLISIPVSGMVAGMHLLRISDGIRTRTVRVVLP